MSQPADSPESSATPLAPAPPNPLPTSPFAALEAEVLEDADLSQPATSLIGDSAIPYASLAKARWESNYPLPYQSQYPFHPPLPKEKVYSVPKRFGLSALLALITALACLFGGLRRLDTPPVIYLFLGTAVMAICVDQMFYNAEQRRASMIAGAILMPIFLAGPAFFVPGPRRGAVAGERGSGNPAVGWWGGPVAARASPVAWKSPWTARARLRNSSSLSLASRGASENALSPWIPRTSRVVVTK